MTASIIVNQAETPKALVIFSHGAGADKSCSFMEDFTERVVKHNISVLRFNFPYMDRRINEGRKFPPDRMPKLLVSLSELLTQQNNELPVFLMGKSMGSRVAATFMSDDELVIQQTEHQWIKGVIALGYPFHPQNKPEKLRLEPVQTVRCPMLILQGDRDKLGSKEEIALYELSSAVEVSYLPDGDHDLKPRVKSGFSHDDNLQVAADKVAEFIKANV